MYTHMGSGLKQVSNYSYQTSDDDPRISLGRDGGCLADVEFQRDAERFLALGLKPVLHR